MCKDLTPKIRFKGFTDAWEQRKLTDFVDFFGGQTYSPKNVMDKGTLILRSSNVQNGEINKDDSVFVDSNIINTENVEIGDIIVVVRNGSRNLIGKHAQIKQKMPNTVIGAFMSGIKTNHSDFVNSLLNTKMFELEINKNMGATINQITGYMFNNMVFKIPKSAEQDKIGLMFTNIDNLITLHQRKYDMLVNVKKSLLEKLFPKNESKIPEIRFKGFTDAWEQRKLGELVVDTVDNRGKNPPYYCDKGIPIIDNFMIKNDGYPNLNVATRFLDDYLFENFIRKYNEVDDVLITLVGNGIGNIALFPKEKSAIVQNTIGLRFENDKKFKYYSLLSKNNTIIKLDRGMAQPSIRQDELKNIDIDLPKIEEQSKISSLMTNIDNLITLHQRKLEKLNNIKASLLEKMFV